MAHLTLSNSKGFSKHEELIIHSIMLKEELHESCPELQWCLNGDHWILWSPKVPSLELGSVCSFTLGNTTMVPIGFLSSAPQAAQLGMGVRIQRQRLPPSYPPYWPDPPLPQPCSDHSLPFPHPENTYNQQVWWECHTSLWC